MESRIFDGIPFQNSDEDFLHGSDRWLTTRFPCEKVVAIKFRLPLFVDVPHKNKITAF